MVDTNSESTSVERLTVLEAIARMGCSNGTVHYRIKKYGWPKVKGEDGLMRIEIPTQYLSKFDSASSNPEPYSTEVSQSESIPQSELVQTLIQDLKDLYQTQLTEYRMQYEARLKEKDVVIQSQSEQIGTFKVQLEATNNQLAVAHQLVKTHKDNPPSEEASLKGQLETLTATVQALQAQLIEQSAQREKPQQGVAWWRKLFLSSPTP